MGLNENNLPHLQLIWFHSTGAALLCYFSSTVLRRDNFIDESCKFHSTSTCLRSVSLSINGLNGLISIDSSCHFRSGGTAVFIPSCELWRNLSPPWAKPFSELPCWKLSLAVHTMCPCEYILPLLSKPWLTVSLVLLLVNTCQPHAWSCIIHGTVCSLANHLPSLDGHVD